MGWRTITAGVVIAALAAFGAGFVVAFRSAAAELHATPPPPPSTAYPGGHPIDATQIASGKLALERMPDEVTTALEVHNTEIVKTAQLVESKQERIRGTCAPGSAIRVVQPDGTVQCERIPRGVISVSSLSGVARNSTTKTTQGAVAAAVGRYQVEGEDDFLVIPVQLPDGAIVTSFTYHFYDDSSKIDSAAYLYRSDDVALAVVETTGAAKELRSVTTDSIQNARVDNRSYSYFVYAGMSPQAFADLMPIGASVTYRLP